MGDYEREAVALETFAEWLENPPVAPNTRKSRKIQEIINQVAQNARIGAASYRKGLLP